MFESCKVYLRPIEKGDMKSFYKAVQNEDIRYMTGTTREFTMEDLYEHYERITSDETRYDFAVCLKEGDRLIGDLSIMDIDRPNRKAGFRIALHSPAYLNKGYGSEAVRLAMRFTFERLHLNRLQLEVFSHNIRAMKAYEKAGFKKEGTIREALYMNEQYSDEIIMGILKREYEELLSR
ncbi:GNAT family protein [Bacillus haynesii]|uniref:GNAT family N-acetyltransferase n=1 Tax=Bacillus haynesii TaxID=1925021 RepID=UPI002DB79109|nr:GNAT family protein [Bacillus haynesii]MEC1345272.1 GNAT family protein [Bacillus haynesii]MEC1473017.1 GNAT family protein [Bacillus haynesii]MEC1483363.1 GNAT family protein [Bacillus haynesii]